MFTYEKLAQEALNEESKQRKIVLAKKLIVTRNDAQVCVDACNKALEQLDANNTRDAERIVANNTYQYNPDNVIR